MTRNGCSVVQINDYGREFLNQVIKSLHTKTKVNQQITKAYEPSSNCMVKRLNKTIERVRQKVVNDQLSVGISSLMIYCPVIAPQFTLRLRGRFRGRVRYHHGTAL